MTAEQAKDGFQKHWGMALALASAAVYYVLCAWQNTVPQEATITLIITGVAGIAKWLDARNVTTTNKAVEENLNWEKLLAAIGIKESFDDMEAKQAKRHGENQKAMDEHRQAHQAFLASLALDKQQNNAAHQEHRERLSSLEQGQKTLEEGQAKLGEQMVTVAQELGKLSERVESRAA